MYTANPLTDSRWNDFAVRHPCATVFHQRAWLEALNRTYGYSPFFLSSTPEGRPLESALVLCEVTSWVTGRRAVALPFSDHCEPLVDAKDFSQFADWMVAESKAQRWKYVELRPQFWVPYEHASFAPSHSFYIHSLDLTRSLEQLFRNLHKDSLQRRIRRAEREDLVYENGRSQQLIDEFCALLLKTRRRHGLVPQPRSWFANLATAFGDRFQIRVARKGDTPIAALLTLRHRSIVVYKYGCSDETFHHIGGMPFLFWKLIEESKSNGVENVDFGRSDLDQKGLVAFKDRFGGERRSLTYLRHPAPVGPTGDIGWAQRVLKRATAVLPDTLLSRAGAALYRHMG